MGNRGCLLNKLKIKLLNMYKNQHKIIWRFNSQEIKWDINWYVKKEK
jgi:hypothetical protein